ncbi:hypothetical protein M9H77_22703 [Catharanthus roseus]|uniref:Uncharacterized protein n=1 Tax=Catharanthus roseus TaxID=4058 RepID=A0ACC0ASX2_CATRO|nr:hypothetical protein M9H77_22703 [Catharanthus roseus]
MGSLRPKESIPSCLQSTQLNRSNQGTNLQEILAKSWRKNTLQSSLPIDDGSPYPVIDGRPQEDDESMEFNCSSQFFLLIESRLFIGSWSFKSSIKVLQIKEEILGEIGSKFNSYNRIYIKFSNFGNYIKAS